MSERIGSRDRAVVRRRRRDERAVVRLDRLVRDDAREDQLAAAARAPVVRLRLADRDLDVALRDLVVQPDRCAPRGDADVACRPRRLRGSFWKNGMPIRSMRARFSRPIFISVSASDIGKTLPFAQITAASVVPAASSASKMAGSNRDCGVGRNWLSITIATDFPPAISSEKRGPVTGCSSAAAVAAVASGRCVGLLGVDRRHQVGLRDVDLEYLAVHLRVVVRGSDRERVERLVGNRRPEYVRHRCPPSR